jgi:hypothetical protein
MAVVVIHQDFGFKAGATGSGDVALIFKDSSGNQTDMFEISPTSIDVFIEQLQTAKAQALGIQTVERVEGS